MDFKDLAEAQEFIKGLPLEDTEFYVMARDDQASIPRGHAWYGVISQGFVEFDDIGDVNFMLRGEVPSKDTSSSTDSQDS